MLHTSLLGKKYENFALHYIKKIKKYKILARNFSCPAGEIDIIAYDKKADYIVFIEVKYRATKMFGRPLEAITPDKARKIQLTSQVYLKSKGWLDKNFRYDAIEVLDEEVRHIIDAF